MAELTALDVIRRWWTWVMTARSALADYLQERHILATVGPTCGSNGIDRPVPAYGAARTARAGTSTGRASGAVLSRTEWTPAEDRLVRRPHQRAAGEETLKPMSMKKSTSLRLNPETHVRLRELAREIGVSQVALVRTLAFATREEYARCEQRRLAAPPPPCDEP